MAIIKRIFELDVSRFHLRVTHMKDIVNRLLRVSRDFTVISREIKAKLVPFNSESVISKLDIQILTLNSQLKRNKVKRSRKRKREETCNQPCYQLRPKNPTNKERGTSLYPLTPSNLTNSSI